MNETLSIENDLRNSYLSEVIKESLIGVGKTDGSLQNVTSHRTIKFTQVTHLSIESNFIENNDNAHLPVITLILLVNAQCSIAHGKGS